MPVLQPIEEEEERYFSSCLGMIARYRLQFQAMSAAAAIFTAGGMKFAWSVFEAPIFNSTTLFSTHLLTVSWFVGVALGAIIATIFVQRISKNVAQYISAALLLLGGLLSLCAPTTFSPLLCSCLFEGIAYGINQIQSLMTASECAHKTIRGLVVASERVFLWLGICLQLFCTHCWFAWEPINGYQLWHVNQLHGLLVILLSLAALTFSYLHRFESPLWLLLQQRDLAATYVMKRLLGASYPSAEVVEMREECKRALAYNAGGFGGGVGHHFPRLPVSPSSAVASSSTTSTTSPTSTSTSSPSWHVLRQQRHIRSAASSTAPTSPPATTTTATSSPSWHALRQPRNILALLKVLLLRCYATISLSLPLNRAFLAASATGLNCRMNCVYLFALCGVLGSLLGAICVDNYGRRRLSVISLLLCGTCTFLIACMLHYIYAMVGMLLLPHFIFEFVVYLLLCYQIFVSAGVSLTSSVYMTEAFALAVKVKNFSFIVVVEYLLQITLTLFIFRGDFNVPLFFFIVGALGMAIGSLALFCLPETRHLSLYECLLKFNNVSR